MKLLPQFRIALVAIFALAFATFASKVHAADPTLTLTPSTNTVFVGQTFDVQVELTSDGNDHSQTNYEIQFDPTVLQVDANTEDSLFFNYSGNVIDNTNGLVSLSGDFFGGSSNQSGTMAIITFRALAAGSDSLAFTANTEVFDEFSVVYPGSVFTGASVTTNAAMADATLSLSSDFSDWAIGDEQEVVISIDTQGNDVAGADMVFTYDPAVFEFVSSSWKGLLPNQQGFSVDSGNGIITVSGVSDQGNSLNGSGELMGINFRALALGSADFDFDWTAATTTDTNIVDANNLNVDLLTAAPTPLTINVINSATLSFQFGLLDFLGDITTKTGSITVMSESITNSFSTPSAAGEVTGLELGTFTYGQPYDLALRVPGYLATKQNQNITGGVNPAVGFLAFGNLTPGDVNQDDVNNSFDLFQIFNNWNAGTGNSADLNGDGKVNTFDVSLLYAYFNQTAAL